MAWRNNLENGVAQRNEMKVMAAAAAYQWRRKYQRISVKIMEWRKKNNNRKAKIA
jgi:hypothetical protein